MTDPAQSACQIVAAEIRARGTLTGDDGLVLTLLDLIAERDRLRAECDRWRAWVGLGEQGS